MFRNQSIKRKLMTVILLTSGAVIVLACGTFFTYELLTLRQTMALDLSTIGRVVAANSTAALAFDNRTDATEVLSALSADRHIVAAGLYDNAGTLFVRYPDAAPDDRLPALLEHDGYQFARAHLVLQEPVVNANRRLGTLVLKSDLDALYQRLLLYCGLVAVAVALSGLVAFPLSNRLQRHISLPVVALADTAKTVSEGNYSVRAARFGDDELGQLADAFNDMLAKIQGHDASLRQRHERILNAVGEGVHGIDQDGKITFENPAAATMLGWDVQELIGQPAHSVMHHTRADGSPYPQSECQIYATLRDGVSRRVEDEVFWRKDGTRFPVAYLSTPMRNSAGGEIVGVVVSFSDVTARKQAEAQRDNFFALSLEMLGIAGMNGYFKQVNPAFKQTLGYTTDELLTRPFLDLVHPDDRAATLAEVEKLSRDVPTISFENRYRCQDGSWRWLSWKAQPVVEEGLIYCTGRDITEGKEAQTRIAQLNVELQRRAAQLAEANKELESFSYSVSHDLRAPLRHVQGYVEMLQRATDGQLSEQAQRYVNTITEASVEMGQLIDDLLAFSRMGRTEMKESLVRLDAVVQDTIRGLEMATKDRNIVWQTAPLPAVVGDPSLLKQVLANLVGNAVKYSRMRDPAKIEIGCAGEEDGRVILFVRDNGAGFDMQYAHKLFGVFQRLHRAEEFEGTGIGLATAQRIVARHGGRVWAEGAVDEGATFYFTLKRSALA